jgi:aspartyl/asparaginyl-tRNA synthetase
MDRTLVINASEKIGQKIRLMGFVDVIRDHGKITFIDLWDRSGKIQCVGENLAKINLQSAIEIIGEVKKRPDKMINENIETGTVEVTIEKLEILGKAEELPFDLSKDELKMQLPTLLDFRTITLRHPKVAEIFEIQEAVVEGFRKASQELGCVEVFVPTISASSTEGGAEVFKIKYYDHEAFLIQSPQLYKQMMVPVFERVYLLSHAYRSEPSVTTRHLSESIQMDCEMGFMDFEELLSAMEFVGTETIKYVEKLQKCSFDYVFLRRSWGKSQTKDEEAQEITAERAKRSYERAGFDARGRKGIEGGSEVINLILSQLPPPTKKGHFYRRTRDPEYLCYDLLFKGV